VLRSLPDPLLQFGQWYLASVRGAIWERRVMRADRDVSNRGGAAAMSSAAWSVASFASAIIRAPTGIARNARGHAWLAEQQTELLPVPYFHVVFTLSTPNSDLFAGSVM